MMMNGGLTSQVAKQALKTLKFKGKDQNQIKGDGKSGKVSVRILN